MGGQLDELLWQAARCRVYGFIVFCYVARCDDDDDDD